MASNACPCGSGAPYASCCAPLHRGVEEARTAEALMRSRYAAFAKREVEYLWRTLHPDHEDRARPKPEVVAELRDACSKNRYLGLRILESAEHPDGTAHVTFHARVFRAGRDLSFTERSTFARDEGAWRYLTGEPA